MCPLGLKESARESSEGQSLPQALRLQNPALGGRAEFRGPAYIFSEALLSLHGPASCIHFLSHRLSSYCMHIHMGEQFDPLYLGRTLYQCPHFPEYQTEAEQFSPTWQEAETERDQVGSSLLRSLPRPHSCSRVVSARPGIIIKHYHVRCQWKRAFTCHQMNKCPLTGK